MTNTTLFSVGSVTKAFTTTALAILHDRGLLDWDSHEQVRSYLRLNSTLSDSAVNMRDLAGHRTGVGRNDLIWISAPDITRIQGVDLVAPALEQGVEFRTSFIYNNWMYAAAGSYLDATQSKSWEDFLDTEILSPLGMDRTQTRMEIAIQDPNYAGPHRGVGGVPKSLPKEILLAFTAVAPAAGLSSTASDMLPWMRMHLNDGMVPDLGLIVKSLDEVRAPTMPIGHGLPNFPGYLPNNIGVDDIVTDYGLGWILSSYRGYRHVWHNGGTLGHTSTVSLLAPLPDGDGLGLFTSINQESGSESVEGLAIELLRIHVFDIVLGVANPPIDLTTACAILSRQLKAEEETLEVMKQKSSASRQDSQLEPLQPELFEIDYVGLYQNSAWGKIDIFANQTMCLNKLTANLTPGPGPNSFTATASGVWELIFGSGTLFVLFLAVDSAQSRAVGLTLYQEGHYYFSRE